MGSSSSFEIAKQYLRKKVTVTVDRPLGSRHEQFGFKYVVNYGYIKGVLSADGQDLDAYYLGVDQPVDKAEGICIAIIHRLNDDDDKLVVVPEGVELTDEQIKSATDFQEQWFKSEIVRSL